MDITRPSGGRIGGSIPPERAIHQDFMKLPTKQAIRKKPKTSESLKGRFQADIIGLNHQARGVAKIDGKTVFVEGAIPGDCVTLQITEDYAQYALAGLIDIVSPSEDRCQPFCDYFGECGGCRLQMQQPKAQIASKQDSFVAQLSRQLDIRKLEILPPFQAQTEHYRRRAKMVLVRDKQDKSARLGFKAFHSERVIDIENCPILTHGINAELAKIRFDLLPQASRKARDVYLLETEQGVWVSSDSTCTRPGDGLPYYQLGSLRLNFTPQQFIQVHEQVNQALVQQALAWLQPKSNQGYLDLFCGVGNFSLPLAQQAGFVVGVEGLKTQVEQARNNAQNNSLTNTEFYCADLFSTVDHQAWWSECFDGILLDPGRQGAKKLCEQIARFKANKIVYVSCQSATLLRDLKSIEMQGYRITRAQIFDMFPHTDHFESMIMMERK